VADIDPQKKMAPGEARAPGLSVQQILDSEADRQVIPPVYREESYRFLGDDDLAVERYTSYDFHRREVEKMWRVTWQMACREEDIPDVGDHIIYELAEHSIIVVRVAEGTIKAYHNACLHRGRQLRTEGGCVPFFRCPYHGWSWNLDGTLKKIMSEWDFPHIDKERFSLPECHIGLWGGFVFISMADEPQPFDDYLGVLKPHFQQFFPMEHRFKAAHVGAIIDANWKATMEAFIEGYHGPATHPQMAFYVGDENTQYDVYGDTVNRMISAEAVASPVLTYDIDAATIVSSMSRDLGIGHVDPDQIPDDANARDVMADMMRQMMGQAMGMDTSSVSNAELLEAIQYYLFPNMVPWGPAQPLVYRFRPNGDDPNSCIADIMLLMPLPPGMDRPPAAQLRMLPDRNPDWREAAELGALGQVFNQDMQNLPFVQKGLRASKKRGVTLSNYQEIRIRHYHQTIDKFLSA
jgi:phenylpropionate dioxygenase-like ring-hydroxylating dioxygenase large terminal subunit